MSRLASPAALYWLLIPATAALEAARAACEPCQILTGASDSAAAQRSSPCTARLAHAARPSGAEHVDRGDLVCSWTVTLAPAAQHPC